MENREANFWSMLPAFFIGGVVGAIIMALMTPQNGREMRSMLMNRGQDLIDRAKESTNKTGKVVSDLSQQAVDRATNVFRHGKDMAEDIKSNVEGEAKSKSVQFGK